ncbi:MAG: AAA family ATPase [Kofleriaceae bacterium]|nr:AAA family ATPase [Kofleriaceae bacterium]MCL4224247.1 AAA family ATPase [Myxococcales bacterium]
MSYPYISRIEIEHFRNLHGLQADIAPSAVIVGENRSGKSNLLHALRLVLDPSLPDSSRELRPEDFWDGLAAPYGGESISVRVFLSGFEGDADAECVLADCLVSNDPMVASLTYLYRPKASRGESDEGALTEDDYEFVVYGGDDEAHAVGRDVRRWLALTVLPAMRDAESQLAGARRPLLRPLLDRVRPALDPKTLEEVGGDLEAAAEKLLEEKPFRELQDRINDRVREVVGPHLSVSTQFGFAASAPEQLLRSLRLYLVDGKLRAIADASLGTANVLYLCLLLQDLDERRERKDSAGTVLAIEEPEAHLHPHLQRLLFRYALRRDHSVLVTTHSPHIASVAPLASLAVLRVTGETGKPEARLFSVSGLELSEHEVSDLERYLDVTRAEMLFARGIIFVEGIAEEFLIPAFAAAEMERRGLGSSLDELGITVCSVAGTDFAPYWRVTSEDGWSIPRVVVTDGDPDAEGVLAGLARGARLLGDADLIEKTKSDEADDAAFAAKALRGAGIYVGARTLELDLVAGLAEEMKEAFVELVGANRKKTVGRFNDAVDDFAADADDGAAIVEAIERAVGKGRFAQRLASKITKDHEPPEHIKKALARIFARVPHA